LLDAKKNLAVERLTTESCINIVGAAFICLFVSLETNTKGKHRNITEKKVYVT
jgi:hypothetical protein